MFFNLSYSHKLYRDLYILAFKEIKNRDKIEQLYGCFLLSEILQPKIDKNFNDEWFLYELINLEVYDTKNQRFLGLVKEAYNTPSYTLLLVNNNKHEFYIPFTTKYIKHISSKKKKIWINDKAITYL